ncbi:MULTISPECIES: hypothetical protein [unclassified Streptomyces]|nr:hypothetical protein [Streptomyces sp. BvitLS-983]MYX88477.1 hypothetical protein [Streptomyces sp. SID4915]SCE17154.1 hypothetical protein GA0115250_1447110 [Streptomyces sp. BvitLS-983]
MGKRLAANVHVRDPRTHQLVHLAAGDEPEPVLAELITTPSAWEDGEPPAAVSQSDDDGDSKQAARKTAAAKPARGRKAADAEGDGGQ